MSSRSEVLGTFQFSWDDVISAVMVNEAAMDTGVVQSLQKLDTFHKLQSAGLLLCDPGTVSRVTLQDLTELADEFLLQFQLQYRAKGFSSSVGALGIFHWFDKSRVFQVMEVLADSNSSETPLSLRRLSPDRLALLQTALPLFERMLDLCLQAEELLSAANLHYEEDVCAEKKNWEEILPKALRRHKQILNIERHENGETLPHDGCVKEAYRYSRLAA